MDLPGLPPIPAKRYFTIGEVSELCAVKPYVLRYWEQEFSQLRPMKRRGNRRYYQHHEVLLIRRIRELLYEEGFTISGARNRLVELASPRAAALRSARAGAPAATAPGPAVGAGGSLETVAVASAAGATPERANPGLAGLHELRAELQRIRALLEP
ncbi:MAG: MerR family transcriptional regulator [Rubrivivax sp.]